MGIIGVLAIIKPMMMVISFGMIVPMSVAALIWVIGDLIGAAGYLSGNPLDNTGNIAHLSGIFLGIIYGIILRINHNKKIAKTHKIEIPEHLLRRWETLYMDH